MNTINEATISLIKNNEGCVLTAYPDPGTGNSPWTIGYGHTGKMSLPVVTQGMVIDQVSADQYLRNDLQVAGARVAALIKVELTDNQFGALVSFYFNVGETTFAKSSVLAYVNQKRFAEVPGRLALYRLANGKILNGLVKRRHEEASLWLTDAPTTGVQNGPATSVAEDTNPAPQPAGEPAQNNNRKLDLPAIGALLTLLSSLSADFKNALSNFSGALDLQPWQMIAVVGVAFAGWSVYNKFKKDK